MAGSHAGRCWWHCTPEERAQAGWARELSNREEPLPEPPKPEPAPDLRLLPRMPSDAEVIERLRVWAAEFDELDPGRYTAAEFVRWVELEHLPRRRHKLHPTDAGPPEYSVVGAARAMLYG